jgi:hypothetical protein
LHNSVENVIILIIDVEKNRNKISTEWNLL